MPKIPHDKGQVALILKKDSIDWMRQFAGIRGTSLVTAFEIVIAEAQFRHDLDKMAEERTRLLVSS